MKACKVYEIELNSLGIKTSLVILYLRRCFEKQKRTKKENF